MPTVKPMGWTWFVLGILLLIPGIVLATDTRADELWVSKTLARMTVEEKVGQLFVSRVRGTTADTVDPKVVEQNRQEAGVDNALELVKTYHIGGLVYFGDNITTPTALARFGNAIQAVAEQTGSGIPILTTIDQEQGWIARIGPPATQFPGSMALGASRQPAQARTAARITGKELAARAQRALEDKRKESRRAVIAQIKELADSIGVTVTITDGDRAVSARKGSKVAAKYRNPHNPDQTWTGRGVKPRWLAALVNEGRQIEEFLI